MTGKILVTYASRTGSTVGVAQAIGQTLAENGTPVEVLPMNEVKDLSPYQAVVAGSAIQGSKWLPEAMQFMQTHRAALAQKRFAAFMVCITLGMKGGENYRDGISKWMEPVRSLVKPVSEGMFAGAIDMKKLPLSPAGLGVRLAVIFGIFPRGDRRAFGAIRAWAESIRSMM